MQILVMLAFLVAWLVVLWIGSLALEATGLDRPRSRFQALSALTGTGFTTTQAELIVEHVKRRKIVTYLIFLGNTAVLGFIVLLVLYIIAGIEAPSPAVLAITIAVIVAIALAFWLGLIDRISNGFLKIGRKPASHSRFTLEGTLPTSSNRAVARIRVSSLETEKRVSIAETGLNADGVTILLIEHDDEYIRDPLPDYKLQSGDIILCYGPCGRLISITQ